MTFTTFVMFDMFNALCCRSADKIVPQMDMFANKAFMYSVGGSLLGQVRLAVFSEVQLAPLCSKCRTFASSACCSQQGRSACLLR